MSDETTTPPVELKTDETGWLVEISDRGQLKWFCAGPEWNWTRDASEALRFARRVDAERFGRWSTLEIATATTLRYTEHEWSMGVPRPVPVPAPEVARDKLLSLLGSWPMNDPADPEDRIVLHDCFQDFARGYTEATDNLYALVDAILAADMLSALSARLAEVEGERDELQQTFDLRWAADMRAVTQWRAERPGRQLTLPDHADLVVWLLGQLEPESMSSERVRQFALEHDHLAVPIRPGVTVTWTDEETGEVIQRGTLKGRNVVDLPLAAPNPAPQLQPGEGEA